MRRKEKQKNDLKKIIRKKHARLLTYITSFLFIISLAFLWNEDIEDDKDLSIIGKGDNVIVQVHDPG